MKQSKPATSKLTLLERCIALAVEKHAGQTDREGQPYILHVLRVLVRMPDEVCRLAAVLHDVVEDSEVTLDDLRAMGVPEEAVEAVGLLTHSGRLTREAYLDHVRALTRHRVARVVKRADLLDKFDIVRMGKAREKDLPRLNRFLDALAILDAAEGGAPIRC